MLLSEAYDIFLSDRKINGVTDKTLEFYHYTIGRLVAYVEEDIPVVKLPEYVRPYLLDIQRRGLSPHTVHTLFRGFRTFLRFAAAEGFIEDVPTLPKLKAPAGQIKPLTAAQVLQAMEVVDDGTFIGQRNATIIRLLFDTGMRVTECGTLKVDDVELEEGFLCVMGKGRKERWLPFSRGTRTVLWAYIKRRAKVALPGESALFVTHQGTGLKVRAIQMFFKRLANRLAMEEVRFSPHTLRHSFALHYIENGGDPFSLQRILGHTTQNMTARYINMARGNLKVQHTKFSPGDRL